MDSTKTTLYLPDSLRGRLKALAAQRGRTLTELIAEGAELVLSRYQGEQDSGQLRRRAAEARLRLRQGLYSGPAAADRADELVYGSRRPAPRRRRAR